MSMLIDLIFPLICLHCEAEVEESKQLFCKGCSPSFELIDPTSRCVFCFNEMENQKVCAECKINRRPRLKMASALDYLGAVCSLVKNLKDGKLPYLAQTAAAFMVAQLIRLDWPTPDIIVPVPNRNGFFSTDHAQLIAQDLARRLNKPCQSLIKRRLGDLSQARLSKKQRSQLPADSFYLKKGTVLDGKLILLVDDVLTTGSTLHNCFQALSEAFPAQTYALTLARTII